MIPNKAQRLLDEYPDMEKVEMSLGGRIMYLGVGSIVYSGLFCVTIPLDGSYFISETELYLVETDPADDAYMKEIST